VGERIPGADRDGERAVGDPGEEVGRPPQQLLPRLDVERQRHPRQVEALAREPTGLDRGRRLPGGEAVPDEGPVVSQRTEARAEGLVADRVVRDLDALTRDLADAVWDLVVAEDDVRPG